MTARSMAGSNCALVTSQTMASSYVAQLGNSGRTRSPAAGNRSARSYAAQSRLIGIALSLGGPLLAFLGLVGVILIQR
jgi:hypothetical protein